MEMAELTLISTNKCFGGTQKVFSHISKETACLMKFSIYLPESCKLKKLPVLYWLSGLTCTEANFVQKAGSQQYANQHNIIIVCPDTSPRNCGIEGALQSWDFGEGAGFYVDATTDIWKNHYRMYSYVTSELVEIINSNFPTNLKQSIFGHSMGGHGALISALKIPGFYKSVSAFAPICNPMKGPLGQKAFTGYLGSDEEAWKEYDATELVKAYNGPVELFIDLGSIDEFINTELLPNNLIESAKDTQVKLIYKLRENYDHNYFFIASFIGEHIAYHAKYLKA